MGKDVYILLLGHCEYDGGAERVSLRGRRGSGGK